MKQRILQIFLAVIALAAAVYGAYYWQQNYLEGVAMLQIPVPKNDIPPYTLLSADMFELHEYPRALGGYAGSIADLEGRISAGTLLAGLPVPLRMAFPPEQFRLADPALEVVSLPAEAVNAAGGQVRIGEWINIYRLKVEKLALPALADRPGSRSPEQSEEAVEGLNVEGLDLEPSTLRAEPQGEVFILQPVAELVARVPVVAVLADSGQPVSSGADGSQPQPMKILVVAAPHETVQAILEAIAASKLQGELLWITLATP